MGDSAHPTPHGQKRHPDDELNHEQRLAKRFNLLNLEQNGKLYIPVKPESASTDRPGPPRRRRSNAVTDAMPVENSKDTVYIHNLDEELADIESEDEKRIFLPDIERHLMKIPKHLLTGGPDPDHDQTSSQGNEVVLYNVPGSISVPEEQDVVRKAIAESRARARRHAHEANGSPNGDATNRGRAGNRYTHDNDDDDVMDVE